MKKYFLLFLALLPLHGIEAAYTIVDGKLVNVEDMAEYSVQEHSKRGLAAFRDKKWEEAVHQFRIIKINFPESDLAKEGLYYLGAAYYHTNDMDLANRNLSLYLQYQKNPKFFLETFSYKLAIADAFRDGARKHLLGQEKMPKVFAAQEEAVKLYDEIIAALSSHELAAQALEHKAALFFQNGEFVPARDTYLSIIKKFPKSEHAAEGYLKIATLFLEQARLEFQHPDLLAAAEINLSKFQAEFPKATEKHESAKAQLMEMKEVFARGLYETGQLYERKKLPKASIIYYNQVIQDFPDTKVAQECRARIQALDRYAKELSLAENIS
jgi:outer membrane protein assembly factor BamD (BamD/ComL family)